jgi:hypothetical protein
MGHTHAAADRNVYYLDQLCTIGFCGALGLVQILLYHYGVLEIILSRKFHVPVLLGGIVLLALAVVRGVALWVSVGKGGVNHAHDHDCCHEHDHGHDHAHEDAHAHEAAGHVHSHDHAHDHEHAHVIVAEEHVHALSGAHDHDCCSEPEHGHTHSHDCGHDHGWAPWRYVVLLLPILLFLLGLPWPVDAGDDDPLEAGVEKLTFKELQEVNRDEQQRSFWEGKLVRVKGQFAPGRTDKTFTLYRMKMTCCAADAYPLNVTIVSPEVLSFENLQSKWVNVTGKLTFEKPRGRDEYVAILKMRTINDVVQTSPDSTPFMQ